MNISEKGLDFIKSFEGCRLSAYKAFYTEKYFTIGWGHYGPDVRMGMTWTQEQADNMLREDIKIYENAVRAYDGIYHWTQSEFDALTSFAYNLGCGSIAQVTAKGSRSKAVIAEKMLLYYNCNGVKLAGLVRRRQAEHDMFLSSGAQDTGYRHAEPTLRRRCKNDRVKLLQENCNKYFGRNLVIDGSYGPLTQAAIREIQANSGKLEADGIYGPLTASYFREVATHG